jgi:hypothetical protein
MLIVDYSALNQQSEIVNQQWQSDFAADPTREAATSRRVLRTRCVRETWAHQDSNLGQAGYEPAALTAELWARTTIKVKGKR